MTTKIQYRRDTAAAWTSANPVLDSGEPAYESDTGKSKLGNGTTAWTSLPYQGQVDLSDLATKDDLTLLSQQKVNTQTYTAKVASLETAIGGALTAWKPSTAYASGTPVLSPSGEIVRAKTAHTSGTTYAAGSWDVTAGLTPATGGSGGFIAADPANPEDLVISLASGSPFSPDPTDDGALVVNL